MPTAKRKKTTKKRVAKKRPVRRQEEADLTALQTAIEPHLRKLVRSGHYLIACYHVAQGKVKLWRKTSGFPPADFDTTVDLLDEELREEAGGLRK